ATIAAARAAATRTLATARLAAARASARSRIGAVAARLGTARPIAIRIEGAWIGVVGREVRRIAWVAVRVRGTPLAAASTGTACVAARATRTGATGAVPGRLAAVRFALTARTVGVAMAAGAGVDAVGDVPGAERRRVLRSRARLAATRVLSGLARTFRLECLVELLGRGLAADGETAMR